MSPIVAFKRLSPTPPGYAEMCVWHRRCLGNVSSAVVVPPSVAIRVAVVSAWWHLLASGENEGKCVYAPFFTVYGALL